MPLPPLNDAGQVANWLDKWMPDIPVSGDELNQLLIPRYKELLEAGMDRDILAKIITKLINNNFPWEEVEGGRSKSGYRFDALVAIGVDPEKLLQKSKRKEAGAAERNAVQARYSGLKSSVDPVVQNFISAINGHIADEGEEAVKLRIQQAIDSGKMNSNVLDKFKQAVNIVLGPDAAKFPNVSDNAVVANASPSPAPAAAPPNVPADEPSPPVKFNTEDWKTKWDTKGSNKTKLLAELESNLGSIPIEEADALTAKAASDASHLINDFPSGKGINSIRQSLGLSAIEPPLVAKSTGRRSTPPVADAPSTGPANTAPPPPPVLTTDLVIPPDQRAATELARRGLTPPSLPIRERDFDFNPRMFGSPPSLPISSPPRQELGRMFDLSERAFAPSPFIDQLLGIGRGNYSPIPDFNPATIDDPASLLGHQYAPPPTYQTLSGATPINRTSPFAPQYPPGHFTLPNASIPRSRALVPSTFSAPRGRAALIAFPLAILAALAGGLSLSSLIKPVPPSTPTASPSPIPNIGVPPPKQPQKSSYDISNY